MRWNRGILQPFYGMAFDPTGDAGGGVVDPAAIAEQARADAAAARQQAEQAAAAAAATEAARVASEAARAEAARVAAQAAADTPPPTPADWKGGDATWVETWKSRREIKLANEERDRYRAEAEQIRQKALADVAAAQQEAARAAQSLTFARAGVADAAVQRFLSREHGEHVAAAGDDALSLADWMAAPTTQASPLYGHLVKAPVDPVVKHTPPNPNGSEHVVLPENAPWKAHHYRAASQSGPAGTTAALKAYEKTHGVTLIKGDRRKQFGLD